MTGLAAHSTVSPPFGPPPTACMNDVIDQLLRYATDLNQSRKAAAEVQRSCSAVVYRLARVALEREVATTGHVIRVPAYSQALARHLGLSRCEVAAIASAAPLHDLGKISIPTKLLRKQGPLTRTEREVMKRHTVVGGRLLEAAQSLAADGGP